MVSLLLQLFPTVLCLCVCVTFTFSGLIWSQAQAGHVGSSPLRMSLSHRLLSETKILYYHKSCNQYLSKKLEPSQEVNPYHSSYNYRFLIIITFHFISSTRTDRLITESVYELSSLNTTVFRKIVHGQLA